MTMLMIADYVPAKAPASMPVQVQVKTCEVCGHEIRRRHVELTGYGDLRRWCEGCSYCRELRDLTGNALGQ
jgi:hypothetical protein